jgi:hypothetical protein
MGKSLWGDLSSLQVVNTPKAILQEQADELTRGTNGLLVGHVDTYSFQNEFFQHDLVVVVPSLNGYRRTLLSIVHAFELYPVYFGTIGEHDRDFLTGLDDEPAFLAELGERLASPEIRTVLTALKSQA